MAERERPRIDVERPRCPYCHEAVGQDDEKTGCGVCMAWHHRGCWSEHGRCSACGATEAAGAPMPVVVRPGGSARVKGEMPSRSSPGRDHERLGAWFMVGIGGTNVLFFAALAAWAASSGKGLIGVEPIFITVGALLTLFGLRTLRRLSRR